MLKAAWSEASYHLFSVESWADGLSMTFWVKGLFKNFGQKMMKTQIHHFATNKHSFYTKEMDKIAKQFGLDLDGAWNKAKMPHSGRHTHNYHEFVLEYMLKAAREAGGSQVKFLQLFDKYVKKPVLNNPKLLQQ